MRFNLKANRPGNNIGHPSAKEKQLSLNLTYDSRIPQYLIGDVHRLYRVILNLVSNAIKFTPQGSVDVRLQLIQHQRQRIVIQCQIQDTGIGIPQTNKR